MDKNIVNVHLSGAETIRYSINKSKKLSKIIVTCLSCSKKNADLVLAPLSLHI